MTPTVQFHLDKQADIENWYSSINSISYGMNWSNIIPIEIYEDIQWKSEILQKEIIEKHINTIYSKHNLKDIILSYNQRRENNNKKLREKMEIFIGKSFPIDIINVYITTINRCPYNSKKRSCMYCPFREWKPRLNPTNTINTILHETLHMMVHYYYEDYIKSKWLSNNEFHDLKEAQTIILNTEYKDILPRPDTGYNSHQSLRKKLETYRINNKNFDQFIDYWISLIKEWNYLDS